MLRRSASAGPRPRASAPRTRACRPARALAECVLYCTVPDRLPDAAAFARLQRLVRWTSYGGDCCAYGFVAMGGADLLLECGLRPYDWCALVPIVQEAGGVLLDWH